MSNSRQWAEEAALSIGKWVLLEAVEQGEGFCWRAWQPDRDKRTRVFERRLIGGSLYGGTAGIALFLSELGRVTERAEYRRAARRALLHSIQDLRSGDVVSTGLYSGTAGWLFSAGTFLRHHDDPHLRELALEVFGDLVSTPPPPRAFDLIGGAAGTIIGLLGVSDVFDASLLEAACTRLGEHLLSSAHVEATGLSWPSGIPRGANLCGLAHGAAGIGWALLELYLRTGRASFKLGAEEAFAYEDLWFDRSVGNWTDLRNNDLSQIQSEGRVDDLEQMLRDGEALPVYRKRFMAAWCHGGPGIGLTRARALAVFGCERYRKELEAALGSYELPSQAEDANHSLCHGWVGNALARIQMARALGLDEVASDTQERLRSLAQGKVEAGEHWVPGGVVRDAPDPTLMVGEAGIGLGLLGLVHDVVSPLFPAPRHPDTLLVEIPDAETLLESMALAAFPATTAVVGSDTVRAEARSPDPAPEGQGNTPTMPALTRRLQSRVEADEEVRQVFQGDLLALRRARRGFDRSFSFLQKTLPVEDHVNATMAMAPWIEVANVNGDAWLLLPDQDGRWKARHLTPPLLALLDTLRAPMTRAGLEAALCRSLGAEPEALRPWLRGQAQELVRAGIVISGPLAGALRQTEKDNSWGTRSLLKKSRFSLAVQGGGT